MHGRRSVGVQGGDDNGGEGKGNQSDGVGEIGVDIGIMFRGDRLVDIDGSVVGGGIYSGSDEGDDV